MSTWRISKTPTRQPGREPCRAKLIFETQSTGRSHTRVQTDEITGSEKSLRHSLSDLEAYTSPRNIFTSGPIRLQHYSSLKPATREAPTQSEEWQHKSPSEETRVLRKPSTRCSLTRSAKLQRDTKAHGSLTQH